MAQEQHNYRVYIDDRNPVNVLTQEMADAFVRQSGGGRHRIEKQARQVIYGTSDEVHRQLQAYHQRYGIDEFIIHTPVVDPKARLTSISELGCGIRSVTLSGALS